MIKDFIMMIQNTPTLPMNTVFSGDVPQRIDLFLAGHHGQSRTYFQELIALKHVFVNDSPVKKPSLLLKQGDTVAVHFPTLEEIKALKTLDPGLKIEVVFEHEDFLVINKPAHLSVHAPSQHTNEGSLVDWLLSRFQELENVGSQERPGIVHRLDKDTSGLLLVARNRIAHELLSDMFKQRQVKKTYHAVVKGHPEETGAIDFPIARDTVHRIKMTHKSVVGRDARTEYKVLRYFKEASLLELRPLTGRTHQLRVHCAALGYPIIGDRLYGSSSKLVERQALHAVALEFVYKGQPYFFSREAPDDFAQLIAHLE